MKLQDSDQIPQKNYQSEKILARQSIIYDSVVDHLEKRSVKERDDFTTKFKADINTAFRETFTILPYNFFNKRKKGL